MIMTSFLITGSFPLTVTWSITYLGHKKAAPTTYARLTSALTNPSAIGDSTPETVQGKFTCVIHYPKPPADDEEDLRSHVCIVPIAHNFTAEGKYQFYVAGENRLSQQNLTHTLWVCPNPEAYFEINLFLTCGFLAILFGVLLFMLNARQRFRFLQRQGPVEVANFGVGDYDSIGSQPPDSTLVSVTKGWFHRVMCCSRQEKQCEYDDFDETTSLKQFSTPQQRRPSATTASGYTVATSASREPLRVSVSGPSASTSFIETIITENKASKEELGFEFKDFYAVDDHGMDDGESVASFSEEEEVEEFAAEVLLKGLERHLSPDRLL